MSRSTAWYPATTALKRMMSTMTIPAKSSTLPYPNVKRLLTPRRVSAKAIHRGMAVAASPKLWMVSDSRATLPDSSTTTSCITAVAESTANDHLRAQIPRSEVAIVGSTAPWVWRAQRALGGGRGGILRDGRSSWARFYPRTSIIHPSAWKGCFRKFMVARRPDSTPVCGRLRHRSTKNASMKAATATLPTTAVEGKPH
jgi:hypothetical protein